MTDSLSALEKNIQRARYFVEIHEAATAAAGRSSPPARFRELPRATVVFAIGALDAYLSEVSATVMIAQVEAASVSGQSRTLLGAVCRSVPTLALELALLDDRAQRIATAREAIVAHFHENVAQHGSKAVNTTLERFGGSASRVWHQLQAAEFADPAIDLDKWTDIRHRIVHRGEKPRVRRADATQCVDLVDALARSVDGEAEKALADMMG